jgi:hypothetical protein
MLYVKSCMQQIVCNIFHATCYMYDICFENLKFVWQLLKKRLYQNFEYEVQQFGPKNPRNHIFSFLEFEEKA